ncbi:MAG: hypothetical protein WA126_14830 [Thermodesulfovibrionales bacterium]
MRATVKKNGVLIPKDFFKGVKEVEIHKEDSTIRLVPVQPNDPILKLGSRPVSCGAKDASKNHDRYL